MSLTCTAYHFSAKHLLAPIICTVMLLFVTHQSPAQNLFANPGLEDLNTCAEYHATCAPEAWFYIKPTTNPLVNGALAPRPMLGTNLLLLPVSNVFDPEKDRSFVYTMFTCPLVKGEAYKLSFYINTIGRPFYNLDFYLTDTEPASRHFNTRSLMPSFSITPGNIVADMKLGWKAVEYYFTATGNQQFCMLGNLSAPMPYGIKDRMNAAGMVFYFLDELMLKPVNPMPPCADREATIKKIYDQDYRHSEFVLADPIHDKPQPPVFVTDTITIPAVFFESNSAVLKPAFGQWMDSIALILPAKNIAKIDVVGHTDNRGTPAKNTILSLERATAVKDRLVKRLPQYTANSFATGKGQSEPVADNNTEVGRARNRCVAIILTVWKTK